MKDFNKCLKDILKNPLFSLQKTTRKRTIKVVHSSRKKYSIHPGDNAIRPLEKWVKNILKK